MNVTAHFYGHKDGNKSLKSYDFSVRDGLTSSLESLKATTNIFLTECIGKAPTTVASSIFYL
jgi:hypothetical protein